MRRALAFVPIALSFALLAGCEKDKPKEEKKSEATPVPSDMVFNDFLPATGGNANGLGVRDAGLDGALAAVNGADPGAADPGSATGGPADKLTVINPGTDPKALRKYNFAANRLDKRLLTLTQSMAQSMGGQTSPPPPEQVLKMYLDLTPKQVKPASSTIEVKLTKIEIPGAPPQAVPMLASLNGLAGTFEASVRGDAGEVQFAGSPQMQQNQLAEPVIGGLSQAVQLLLAPFPDAPVGVGAKWEIPQRPDQQDQGSKRFTLKELTADGAVVEAELEIKVPRHQQPAQRGQPPMTVEVDGKGKYTYQIKFDHLSTRVEGELTVNEKIEAVDPRSGQKQAVTRIQKAKHLLETPSK